MPLITLSEIISAANKTGSAVGAFSVGNMEMIEGAVKAAEELNTPIILQIAEVRLPTSPLHLMGPMMISAAKKSDLPICVHLDHGLHIETVEEALELGFSSVMFDGSLLAFNENIETVKKVKKLADAKGASVEAELGVVGGNEGEGKAHAIQCTDPELAKVFCEKTGIDALAVAIGNAHGHYPVAPQLRLDVLENINKLTDTPLVLHGGTGITPQDFRECIKRGIRKINIATAGFDSLTTGAKKYFDSNEKNNFFGLSEYEMLGVYKNTKKHINIFNMEKEIKEC